MEKYDGWVIKTIWQKKPRLLIWTCAKTRKEVMENWGEIDWKGYKGKIDFKIVKVKLVEVE